MNHIKRLLCVALLVFAMIPAVKADDFSAKEVVLEHIKDSHEWHITDLVNSEGQTEPIAIPTMPMPADCVRAPLALP